MSQQQLLAALNALYHHEDAKVKDEADRWLEQWQQSAAAWSVADAVLHDASSSMEAQYFCAQTLRTKVQRDFEELPEQAVQSLRESLLTLLIKYSKGAPPVRTQLCLALASMCVHVPAQHWGEGGAVSWFGTKLQAAPVEAALPCLLELLTVLPQEVNSPKVAVRPERRRQHAQELSCCLGMALEMLTSCLSAAPGERSKEQALEAFGAWLRLSGGKNLPMEGLALATHPLTSAALSSLSSSDTFYAAVDAVCELIWVTVDPETQSINGAMMPLIQRVVPAVMELRPRFAIAARRLAAEQNVHGLAAGNESRDDFDDDEDTAKGMARLFAEVGEAYINLVASAVQEVKAPVEAMLEVAAYPDFSIAAMSLNFWAKLARQLRGRREGGTRFSPAAAPVDAAEVERLRRVEFFKPAFEKLIVQIRGRLRYPEQRSSWSKEEHQEFKRQRVDIADTLEDAAGVLGFPRALQLLLEPLQQLSSDVAAGQAFDWRAAEAALYCIRSISYHATDPSDVPLLQLLRILPGLPSPDPQLQYTACAVAAQYAPWLGGAVAAGRADAAELPPALLGMAVAALGRSESAAAGAKVLSQLADHCGAQLAPCMDVLLGLYHGVLRAAACSGLAAAGGAAAAGAGAGVRAVHEEDVHMIMRAVCTASSKCLPPEQLRSAAASLVQPILDMLQQVVAQLPATFPPPPPPLPSSGLPPPPPPPAPSGPLQRKDPYLVPLIDRLATVLQGFSRPDLVADLLGWSWQLLDAITQRCPGDNQVLEQSCRAIRYAVKGAGKACAPMLPTLLDVLPRRFRETRHSALLYIFSELVKIFGDQPGHDAALAPVLQQLLSDSCQGLQGLRQLEQSPDLVDDTLLLVNRTLGYCPRLVLTPPATALAPLMNMAMLGVLMQHREACCTALAFICRLLEPRVLEACPPGAAEARQQELVPRGALLMRLLLAGVAGCVPFSRLTEIAAALTALLRCAGATGSQWLGAALNLLPDSAVAQSDKQQLMDAGNTVAAGNSMSRDDQVLDAALGEFGDLCRRTRRVMQEVQRVLLPAELLPEFNLNP